MKFTKTISSYPKEELPPHPWIPGQARNDTPYPLVIPAVLWAGIHLNPVPLVPTIFVGTDKRMIRRPLTWSLTLTTQERHRLYSHGDRGNKTYLAFRRNIQMSDRPENEPYRTYVTEMDRWFTPPRIPVFTGMTHPPPCHSRSALSGNPPDPYALQ